MLTRTRPGAASIRPPCVLSYSRAGLVHASNARRRDLRIGCSGWHYASWRGDFYPADLPPERWLEAYAQSFDSVELNNSFYRLPEATQFGHWGSRVPPAFLFAVKASRYLTHLLRLTRPQEPLQR